VAERPSVNKCNGDSGGPSFLKLGDNTRVVGIASRSDCVNVTLDVRADAFAGWFDSTMQAGCNDGSRVSCDALGLPTPAALGLSPLPAAEPIADARAVPAAIDPSLRAAGDTVASCYGLASDEGYVLLMSTGFFLGAEGCSAADVAAGQAFFDCVAEDARCDFVGGGNACEREYAAVESALSRCSDADAPPPPDLTDVEPELLAGMTTFCEGLTRCGSPGTLDECIAQGLGQLSNVTDRDCRAAEVLLGSAYSCTDALSCDEFQRDDPGGCFGVISDEQWNNAFDNCDDVPGGAGEGEGEGEGDDDDDDDDDDGGNDRGRTADDNDDAEAPFSCTAVSADGSVAGLALLVFLRLRRRAARA